MEIYLELMNGTHKLVQFQQVNALAATLGNLNSKNKQIMRQLRKKKIG